LITVEDIHKSFGSLHVLKGISFDVRRGDVLVVIGPSGSGKSTLLRCMNLLIQPDRGRILLEGVQVNRPEIRPEWVRQQVGMVFQQFNLFAHFTALENVTLGLRKVRRMPSDEADRRGKELLARVGLAHKVNAYPAELSGGQQQRVAIARALALDPKVVLFDEPTSALDPEYIREVLDVMTKLARDGMTMVVVTHEIGFARGVATRALFMDDGLVLEQGTPEAVIGAPRHERARAFMSKILT